MASKPLPLLKGVSPKAGGIPPAPGPQIIIAGIERQAQQLTDDDLYRLATLLDQQAEERSRQEHERINHHLHTEDAYREHRRLNDQWRQAVLNPLVPLAPPASATVPLALPF